MDVTGLYTKTGHSEGLDAMHKTLEQENRDQKPSANALTLLVRLIVVLNKSKLQQRKLHPTHGDGHGNPFCSVIQQRLDGRF